MADKPFHVGGFRRTITSFVNAHGTRPRLVWTPAVATARAAAGETSVFGSRVHGAYIASNETVANSASLMFGQMLTTVGAGSFAFATTSTLTRAAGSFIDDGWSIGDTMLVTTTTSEANRVLAEITAVTALTLTVTGTPFTAEAIPASTELCRIGQAAMVDVPLGAGFGVANRAIPFITQTAMPWNAPIPDTNEVLGPSARIFVAMSTAVGAGKKAQVTLIGGDY